MDLAKLYKVCTPQRHWETILVNAECVSGFKMLTPAPQVDFYFSLSLQLPREVLPAAARAAGRSITNTLVIVDLRGFGYVVPHFL